MSLHDFIDDGFEIVNYNTPREWDKTKLIEEFPLPEKVLKGVWGYTRKFYKRISAGFPENEIISFVDISKFALEEYGYPNPTTSSQMRIVWRCGWVRRFVGERFGRAFGVHYLFLPKKRA